MTWNLKGRCVRLTGLYYMTKLSSLYNPDPNSTGSIQFAIDADNKTKLDVTRGAEGKPQPFDIELDSAQTLRFTNTQTIKPTDSPYSDLTHYYLDAKVLCSSDPDLP